VPGFSRCLTQGLTPSFVWVLHPSALIGMELFVW
jgi:hypothetical protein